MCKKDSTLEGRKEQTLGCPDEEDFRQEKSCEKISGYWAEKFECERVENPEPRDYSGAGREAEFLNI